MHSHMRNEARGAEAVYLPGDNTAYQAFDGLANQLATARIPLVIDAPEFINPCCLGGVRDWRARAQGSGTDVTGPVRCAE